ncbi:MAG: transposase [Vicinamibacterales bacterium]
MAVPLYAASPVAGARLSMNGEGHVVVQLRHRWADGTTHLVFPPTAFLERLAVLVPRPRINLVLYHGVLAPRAAWRREIVPRTAPSAPAEAAAPPAPGAAVTAADSRDRGWRWADLMRRAFDVDVLACPWCGGRLRLLAVLEASAVTTRILQHLGLPTTVPEARPSRAPPDSRMWAE